MVMLGSCNAAESRNFLIAFVCNQLPVYKVDVVLEMILISFAVWRDANYS